MAIQAIKKSVSFQPEVVKKLSKKVNATHRSFSELVNEAAMHYLEEEERSQMESSYKAYFADPNAKKEESELVKDLSKLSEESWPD